MPEQRIALITVSQDKMEVILPNSCSPRLPCPWSHPPASTFNTDRINHLVPGPARFPNLQLHFGDLTDSSGLQRLLEDLHPDEVYNLGAQSHVRVSFDQPEYTADVVGMGSFGCWKPCGATRSTSRRKCEYTKREARRCSGAPSRDRMNRRISNLVLPMPAQRCTRTTR